MDPNGQIYFDKEDNLPEADKKRLADAEAVEKRLVADLRKRFKEDAIGQRLHGEDSN